MLSDPWNKKACFWVDIPTPPTPPPHIAIDLIFSPPQLLLCSLLKAILGWGSFLRTQKGGREKIRST